MGGREAIIQSLGAWYNDHGSHIWAQFAQFEGRTSHPVDGDALDPADAGGDDVLPPRLIALGPGNPVESHVRPVHGVIACQRAGGV